VEHFRRQRFRMAWQHFETCASIRAAISAEDVRAKSMLKPWESFLPNPEVAASFMNVAVSERTCSRYVCVRILTYLPPI